MLFQFTQAPPEPGNHGNPEIVEIPTNITSPVLNRPWKQSWKRKIKKESIRRLKNGSGKQSYLPAVMQSCAANVMTAR